MTGTRELHQLKRQRSRLLRLIEAQPSRGAAWAAQKLEECEWLKQRIREIERQAT